MKPFLIMASLSFALLQSEISTVEAVASRQSYKAFIPKGWYILDGNTSGIVKGDLNKDGISDMVIVLERYLRDEEKLKNFYHGIRPPYKADIPRRLLILFGQKGGGYSLSLRSDKMLLGPFDGGRGGIDPLEDVKIINNTIVIKHHGGGGNHIWDIAHKWQYSKGKWYLIGETEGDNQEVSGEYRKADVNRLNKTKIFILKDFGSNRTIKVTKTKDLSLKPVSIDIFRGIFE